MSLVFWRDDMEHFEERNLIDLASNDSMTGINENALSEERANCRDVYVRLKSIMDRAKADMPYPDVGPYSVAHDYDEIANLAFYKKSNQRYYDIINEVIKYYSDDSLYDGHLIYKNRDIYFIDNADLKTYVLSVEDDKVLVNPDDKNYYDEFRAWRYPKNNAGVRLSRNITMRGKDVVSVDTVYNSDDKLLSSITDLYLKNALLKNRQKQGIRSIIQTIQEKQDDIRVCDKNLSFIVQGCAGSGKTMVLLHRLRYLQYNNVLTPNNYYFLVPSVQFKEFITKISKEFRLNTNNILPYTEYYRSLVPHGKADEVEESPETGFSDDYLKRVYSSTLISECCRYTLNVLLQYSEKLVDACESALNFLIEEEKKECLKNKEKEQELLKYTLSNELRPLNGLIKHTEADEIDFMSIKDVIETIRQIASKEEVECRQAKYDENRANSDSVLNDSLADIEELKQFQDEITQQNNRVRKASIFTRFAHKRRLKTLQAQYDSLAVKYKERLKVKNHKIYLERISSIRTAYNNFSTSELNEIAMRVERIVAGLEANAAKTQYAFDEEIKRKLNRYIEPLAHYVETHLCNLDKFCNSEDTLDLDESFGEILAGFIELFSAFNGKLKIIKSEGLFKCNSVNELREELYKIAFRKCSDIIKTEYNVTPNNHYKHYWFLKCQLYYILVNNSIGTRRFVYIDEAQDLSCSEIFFIRKCNVVKVGQDTIYPVVELFGDVNQVISPSGIKDWKNINFINKIFYLDENFRNSNQIISYCNTHLPYKMKELGIYIEDVCECRNIKELFSKNHYLQGASFIVKDDVARTSLKEALVIGGYSMCNNLIYTVKEAKGLEFKEIVAFVGGMTDNEKYIAFTRALNKLTIVFSF